MVRKSDPGNGSDCRAEGGGGGGRGKMVFLAIAGGAAAVIAGAALLRRWWIKRAAKTDQNDHSTTAVPLALSNDTTDLILYVCEIDEEEEFIEFDGLTSILPSIFITSEVLKKLANNVGGHTSEFSMEISAGCKNMNMFQPILKKIENQIFSNNDDRLNKTFVYNNGAVVIEELFEDDEVLVPNRDLSNSQEGRLSSKNSGAIINGINAKIEYVPSQSIIAHIQAVIDSCLSLISPHYIVDSATIKHAISYVMELQLKPKPAVVSQSVGQLASPVINVLEISSPWVDLESELKLNNGQLEESRAELSFEAESATAEGGNAEELPVAVKSVVEEVELKNRKEANNNNCKDFHLTDQPGRCHMSAPNWPVLELLPVPELVHEEPGQLASRPQQLVGAETEIKGNITKSESKRSNEEMEEAQAELAKIEKDTNESKALEHFSSNGTEVRAKTEADESVLLSEVANITKAADASPESNREKKKKKKKKKKKNKKNNNNNKGIDELGQPTDANLEISSLAIQVPKENKKSLENERDDPSAETEIVLENPELGMSTEKKKKKKKNNKGMEGLGQEHTQLGQLSEAKLEISSLSVVHEITAESAMAAQIQSKKPNEEAKTVINKKKREKKKDKKKKSKANTATVSSEQAPKVMGGFKQVGPALSCHLATPYRAEKNILKGNGLSREAPNHQEKSYAGLKGMKNLGNTCFMNSILQCLSHCEPLIEKLEMIDHAKPCSSKGFCYICELKEIINDIHRGKKAVISPVKFRDNLSSLMSGFLPGQQADAQEYLVSVLHRIGVRAEEVFCGFLTNKFRCCECSVSRSDSFIPFNNLSVDVSSASTLSQVLKSYTSACNAEDFKFDACRCSSRVEKEDLILALPEVLVFHLMRFRHDGQSAQKVAHHVAYPLQIDMGPYMSYQSHDCTKYGLYAIVEHRGTMNSGHYTSVIKCGVSWYLLNDSEVSQISEREALSKNAYLLFYSKLY